MKITERDLESKVVDALMRCLESVPFVKDISILSEADLGGLRPDIFVDLILPDKVQRIVVECKTVGQPRVARDAVNQLLRYLKDFPDAYGVFAAPYISPKTAEICAGEGIGYLDLAGNGHLSFGQVFIEKTGSPNPFSEKRDLRSLYSPKATRILRVLLLNPRTIWRLQDLAQEADVSLGLVSKVKKLLANREWIISEPTGLRIADPEALLREWGENYTFRKNEVAEFYSLKSIPEIETQIAKTLSRNSIRYALTGFSGADRVAPFTRYHRAMAYVGETDEDLAALLNLKKVTSGANVSLLVPYDEGVFYDGRRIEGVQVASPIQLYLDLRAHLGRGEEAAKEILEKVIRPSW